MKTKPKKHKSDNIFKFRSFSERIADIDVDVFHKIKHPNENDEDSDLTYFFQCIEKWETLNCTEEYKNLVSSLPDNVQTLPQLILLKENIISLLLDHIKQCDISSLVPALELVAALARDLRKEFYPYFLEVLKVCISLLNTQEAEQIESTFVCLAYLFKYLFQHIVKQISDVLIQLLPLLSNSQPNYINEFAAQSFAYVARKVKDRTAFIKQILLILNTQHHVLIGFAQLLFEVIKGVNNQFHSCSTDFLRCLFALQIDKDVSRDLLFSLLIHLNSQIVRYISRNTNFKELWNLYLNTVERFLKQCESELTDYNVSNLCHLLKLIHEMVRYKGRLLFDYQRLIDLLLRSVSLGHVNESSELHKTICDVFFIILSFEKTVQAVLTISFNKEVFQQVTDKVDGSVGMELVERLLENPSYSDEAFSVGISICLRLFSDDRRISQTLLRFLTKLTLVSYFGSSENGVIYFPAEDICKLNDVIRELYNLIPSDVNMIDSSVNVEDVICSIIVTSRVKHLQPDLLSKISVLSNTLSKRILKNANSDYIKGSKQIELFLICADIVSRCEHIKINGFIDIADALLHLGLKFNNIYALKIFTRYLLSLDLNTELVKSIFPLLGSKLSSPFHKMRLAAAKILSSMNEINPLYNTVRDAELVDPSVQQYRDKLQLLQQLECNENLITSVKNEEDLVNIVHFLVGNLYINFRLIWEPTQQLLYSHARNNVYFWKVYRSHLNGDVNSETEIALYNFNPSLLDEPLSSYFSEIYQVNDKPDFTNVRCLLLKTLSQFINLKAVHHLDVQDMFLKFVHKEYILNDPEKNRSCNLKKISGADSDDEDDEVNESNDGGSETITEAVRGVKINKTRLLLAYLEIFSKLNSPKVFAAKQNESLLDVYLDLLTHRNPMVQKLALDCIFVYKQKNILPYKEHLYKLVDNKTYKDELIYFQIDESNSIIEPDHRADVLKLLMRILYGRMTGGIPKKKSSGQHNRELVFRFLAGCREDELLLFIKMVFRKFNHLLEDDALNMIRKVFDTFDVENVIPLKQLLSTLNMVTVLFEQAGSLMRNSGLSYLLRVLLIIASNVFSVLKAKSDIHNGYLGILSKLRSGLFEAIIYFYNYFENYTWTISEIDAVFEIFVWPSLKKITIESVHNPTFLMRLIIIWGTNYKYYHLLVKRDYEGNSCLQMLINLLEINGISNSIRNGILEVIEHLLFSNEENTLDADGNVCESSALLVPYISEIMKHLQARLANEKINSLNRKELTILSSISKFVNDREQSDLLIGLLLPVLMKKCSSDEETVISLLEVIHNLIANIPNSIRYCQQIAPFFNILTPISARKMLCKLVVCMQDNSDGRLDASIITDFNAMDRVLMDKPDYEKRLDAMNKVQKLVESSDISLDMGILVAYNCFYMIRTETDIALRDNSTICLKQLCPFLCLLCKRRRQHKSVILDTVLFPIIRNAIRGNNDNLKHESIVLLGHLARECARFHPVLRDLSLLTDTNSEDDFFENIVHLQIYQKMKALHRYWNIMSQQVNYPQPRTLTQFVFPLISQFLLSKQYANKNSLIDAALNALKVTCQLLPWRQYEKILCLYLKKLKSTIEFQKQIVRIVSTILDAFHYNIALAGIEYQNSTSLDIAETGAQFDKLNADVTSDSNNDADANGLEKEEEDDEEKDELLSEMMESDDKELVAAAGKQTMLSRTDALKISKSISQNILPHLNKCFLEYTQYSKHHKLNKKKSARDEEAIQLLAIPLASAIVKLLYRLPAPALDQNITNIFMKLCTYLKSRLPSIRMIAREIMQNIMCTIGPKYLPQLLSVITSLLTKGFHAHVLVFTCHAVLENMKHLFNEGDINAECLDLIMQLCIADLFGQLSQEKEVVKIAGKTMEARSNKSFNMLHILSQFVSENNVLNIIVQLKNILVNTLSRKIVLKVSECFRHITLGLVENKFVSPESLLILSYGLISESIPALTIELKPDAVDEKELEFQSRRAPNSLILPTEPKKINVNNVKVNARANYHILLEFGLQLLGFMLKREMIKKEIYRKYLDPFIPLIAKFLKSPYVKLNTFGIQCLTWLLKRDLPSLVENVKNISNILFDILYQRATEGPLSKENNELVTVTFKAVAVLVRDVKYHQISADQLKALLLYVEQDMYHYARRPTAFILLRAILKRKYLCNELHSVMKKVFELSIQSDSDTVRLSARQAYLRYLLDYPLKRQMNSLITYCISQLEYDLPSGRASALELIVNMIEQFPIEMLRKQCLWFFVPILFRMLKDDAKECRMSCVKCIECMLKRLKHTPVLKKIFTTVFTLLKSKEPVHRLMGIGGLVQIVCSLQDEVLPYLTEISTLISNYLTSDPLITGQLERCGNSDENALHVNNSAIVTMEDAYALTIMELIMNLTNIFPDLLKHNYNHSLAEIVIARGVQFLTTNHEMVQYSASKLVTYILSLYEPAYVASAVNRTDGDAIKNLRFLGVNLKKFIKTLALNLCAHIVPEADSRILLQALKNLMIIADILKFIRSAATMRTFSLRWLIRRVVKQVKFEIINAPRSTTVRIACYNWFAALTTKFTSDELVPLLVDVMPLLLREMAIECDNNEQQRIVRHAAKECLSYYRAEVTQQKYATILHQVRDMIQQKRIQRHIQQTQLKITDPEAAARRKIVKQHKKKEQRKRKLEKLRGRKIKRRRTAHGDDEG